MKTTKLTSEQLEQMSYADVANLVLEENGKKMKIQDLFSKVIKLMQLPESYFESKIADFFDCQKFPLYNYDDSILVKYEDYHFYKNCPLKAKTDFAFLLFSILCSVNYAIKFIEQYFVEEIPQKFKFAYLQYYYLCDFIKELNVANGTTFYINDSL